MSGRKNLRPQILQLLSDGHKPSEVAQMVGCSRINVYQHIKHTRGWSGYVGPLPNEALKVLARQAEASGMSVRELARKIIEAWAEEGGLMTGPGE